MHYVIKAVSSISGNCTLGDGLTEKEAWEDAYGPRPWSDCQKKSAKKAWCEEIESKEDIRYSWQ